LGWILSSSLGKLSRCWLLLVVDAIEWNRWIKVYIQIFIHHYFTSDHDPYDVLWVVRLVLEDMGEVKMLVVTSRKRLIDRCFISGAYYSICSTSIY
jgi:hypothetical protein